MGKSRANIKWKLRVYDAVIVAKLMYGLSSIPLPKADANKIDAFQMRGSRQNKNQTPLRTGPACLIRDCLKSRATSSKMSRTRVAVYLHIPLDLTDKTRSKELQ